MEETSKSFRSGLALIHPRGAPVHGHQGAAQGRVLAPSHQGVAQGHVLAPSHPGVTQGQIPAPSRQSVALGRVLAQSHQNVVQDPGHTPGQKAVLAHQPSAGHQALGAALTHQPSRGKQAPEVVLVLQSSREKQALTGPSLAQEVHLPGSHVHALKALQRNVQHHQNKKTNCQFWPVICRLFYGSRCSFLNL